MPRVELASAADATTGEGKEFWHNQKDDKDFTSINAIRWTDADHVIFEAEPQEWTRWYSVSVSNSQPTPTTLTPGEGAVEQTAVSADGRFLFYATAQDASGAQDLWLLDLTNLATPPVELATESRRA